MKKYDLTVIGGGIMGLMTAYFASEAGQRVTLLEKRTIGNKQAASFSYTRSMRTDYLDPLYAGLADQSYQLWRELEGQTDQMLLINCGCINLVKKSVTPDTAQSYGARSYQVISELGFKPDKFDKSQLQERFPQFEADEAYLDNKGGYFDLQAIKNFLLGSLKARGVEISENIEVKAIESDKTIVNIFTNSGVYTSSKLVVTAGMWTNDLLKLVKDNGLLLPITLDKPKECRYFYPPGELRDKFLPGKFPVFAYLDVGIYGHPIFDANKNAVKISYYNPTDMETQDNPTITSVDDFVRECLPSLSDVPSKVVIDADQCYYDIIADDNFVIGALPAQDNIIIGAGWRGTGYKFAPLIGKTMAGLANGDDTEYDISKFNPERFIK